METRLVRLLFAARYVLWLERIWPGFSRCLSLILLGIALALAGVPGYLLGWLHGLLLLGWGAGVGFLGWRCVRLSLWPDLVASVRLIEKRQAIPHRALSTLLLDTPVQTSYPTSRPILSLWSRHREALSGVMPRLRWPWPRLDMAGHDPFALRFLPVLLIVIGLGVAGRDAPARLIAALNPGGVVFDAAPSLSLDAWITPPDYTGLPPIMLAQAGKLVAPATILAVPENSQFYARVSASSSRPDLMIDDRKQAFSPAGEQAYQINQPLTGGQMLAIERGHRQWVSWPIKILPDQPPTIAMTQSPGVSKRQAVTLDFAALDDYGLVQLLADMRLEDKIDGTHAAPPQQFPLNGAGPGVKRAEGGGLVDLLAHPWAGLPVTIRLIAKDAHDQQAETESQSLTLPSRAFAHPTARQLVAWRRDLTLWPQTRRVAIADQLATLAESDSAMQEHPANIIALSGVIRRLRTGTDLADVTDAQELMWQIALSLDHNQLNNAADNLAMAKQALEQAINHPENRRDHLDPLIDALEQALNDLQDAVMAEMKARLERGESLPEIHPGPNSMMLDKNGIAALMQKLRDQTDIGARNQARQLLQSLNSLIDQAKKGMMANTPQQPNNPQQAEQQQWLDRMQALVDQQRRLSQKTQQSPTQVPPPEELYNQQQLLRRETGDLMLESDRLTYKVPPAMGDAERAMREAEQSLKDGRVARGLQYMANAEDALQQSLDAMQAQTGPGSGMGPGGMSAGAGGMPMPFGVMRAQTPAGAGRDPLGRQQGPQQDIQGQNTGSDVNLPNQSEAQRAREILEELRRRAGGMARPPVEQEYLKRLLEQF